MMFMWIIRFFLFHLYESPKYLMGRGRDQEAVEVVHKVAAYNGVKSSLQLEHLEGAGVLPSQKQDNVEGVETRMDTSALGAIKRLLSKFTPGHVKGLFATRKLTYSTSLLIVLWGQWDF
jgi:hypothetical protein